MDGLEDLDQALAGVVAALSGEQLQACTQAAAQPILRDAEQRIPRRTGETAQHLVTRSQHTERSATTSIEVLESAAGGQEHQAVFLEYGTEHMAPRPFMRPAFEVGREPAVQTFEQKLQENLKAFT